MSIIYLFQTASQSTRNTSRCVLWNRLIFDCCTIPPHHVPSTLMTPIRVRVIIESFQTCSQSSCFLEWTFEMPLKDCIVTVVLVVHASVFAVTADEFRCRYQSNTYLAARNRFLLSCELFAQQRFISDRACSAGVLLLFCKRKACWLVTLLSPASTCKENQAVCFRKIRLSLQVT